LVRISLQIRKNKVAYRDNAVRLAFGQPQFAVTGTSTEFDMPLDKVVLITGASSGIGAGIARELGAAGARLMLGA
jgi:3-oxoacyl-ACP reductase-like protein